MADKDHQRVHQNVGRVTSQEAAQSTIHDRHRKEETGESWIYDMGMLSGHVGYLVTIQLAGYSLTELLGSSHRDEHHHERDR